MKGYTQDFWKYHPSLEPQTLQSAKDDRMTLCSLYFADVSDKLDLSLTKRRLDKEKYSFYGVNKSVYMTPTVREN